MTSLSTPSHLPHFLLHHISPESTRSHPSLRYVKDSYPTEQAARILLARVLHSLGVRKNNQKALEIALSLYGTYVSQRPLDAAAFFHYGRCAYDLSVHFVGNGTRPLPSQNSHSP